MKVCLVNLGALPALAQEYKHHRIGGEEVQQSLLAAALARRGHAVSIVVAEIGQGGDLRLGGLNVFSAFNPEVGLPAFRFIHPRWTGLWSALGRADAEVYYYSCAGMPLGLLAMFCRLHRRRLVFRAASDSDCEPRQLLIRYARDRWLYEFGLKRADAILVQSLTQQRAMLANYGRSSTLAGMLVAGHPTAKTQYQNIDALWVANLRQVKRPDRLLELARMMPGIRFHMVGGPSPGEESLFARIQREASELSNIAFHGAIPYLDIGPLFDRARVFVNTSEVEGFPNTFLQAWVRGVPVVTTFDPDGVVDRCGLGSSHTSVEGMVGGLNQLLGNADAYRAASEACSAYAEEHFGEEHVLKPYIEALSGSTDRGAVQTVQPNVA